MSPLKKIRKKRQVPPPKKEPQQMSPVQRDRLKNFGKGFRKETEYQEKQRKLH